MPEYCTRDGRRLSEAEALDRDGCIRDGVVLRVPLTMRDGLSPLQRAIAQSSLRVTDGQGGSSGLHRPGFRLPVGDAGADGREHAYAAYEARLRDSYKTPAGAEEGDGERFCPECEGSGLDQKLADCQACHGEGSVPSDYRNVAQMTRDHQNKMADIYDKLDHELSETWRRS
jgi:hypothetical protein